MQRNVRGLEPVPVPSELLVVPRPVLEEYVKARLRQFGRVFGGLLSPQAQAVEGAFNESLQVLGVGESSTLDNCTVKFRHRCRFLGCASRECVLCKNNPFKRCKENDNFDEAYADGQVLRSKCEVDVFLELTNSLTGLPQNVMGLELQLCVIDGESWSESTAHVTCNIRRLLKSDEGNVLIASMVTGTKVDQEGYLYLKLQDGHVRLPDVNITDKNDTFHINGESFNTFRLLARVVKRDLFGRAVPIEGIPPAISGKFVVKTQRALNDYRKSEYPHYKDELTKLKYIGSITAQRLRDIQTHFGYNVPFTSIETVVQLKDLMLYADQNRQAENKLLELLNMKGKHKRKWDYLRKILLENIVYDDMMHRAWYTDDSLSQGLLFTCKQGQVNMDKPVGIFRRFQQGSQSKLQVFTYPDDAMADTIRAWRALAEQAWCMPAHGRWSVAQCELELVGSGGVMQVVNGTGGPVARPVSNSLQSPTMSAQEGMDDAQVMLGVPMHRRQSVVSSPVSEVPPAMRMPSSSLAPGQGCVFALDMSQQNTCSICMPGPSQTNRLQTHMAYSMQPGCGPSPRPSTPLATTSPGSMNPPENMFRAPTGMVSGMGMGPMDPSVGPYVFTSVPSSMQQQTPSSEVQVAEGAAPLHLRSGNTHTYSMQPGARTLQTRLSNNSQDNERAARYSVMSYDITNSNAASPAGMGQPALGAGAGSMGPPLQMQQYGRLHGGTPLGSVGGPLGDSGGPGSGPIPSALSSLMGLRSESFSVGFHPGNAIGCPQPSGGSLQDMSLLKRPRSSVPSGFMPNEDMVGALQHLATMDSGPLQNGEVVLYHSESALLALSALRRHTACAVCVRAPAGSWRATLSQAHPSFLPGPSLRTGSGRHLPRGRKSLDNLNAPQPSNTLAHDSHSLHQLGTTSTAVKFDVTPKLELDHLVQAGGGGSQEGAPAPLHAFLKAGANSGGDLPVHTALALQQHLVAASSGLHSPQRAAVVLQAQQALMLHQRAKMERIAAPGEVTTTALNMPHLPHLNIGGGGSHSGAASASNTSPVSGGKGAALLAGGLTRLGGGGAATATAVALQGQAGGLQVPLQVVPVSGLSSGGGVSNSGGAATATATGGSWQKQQQQQQQMEMQLTAGLQQTLNLAEPHLGSGSSGGLPPAPTLHLAHAGNLMSAMTGNVPRSVGCGGSCCSSHLGGSASGGGLLAPAVHLGPQQAIMQLQQRHVSPQHQQLPPPPLQATPGDAGKGMLHAAIQTVHAQQQQQGAQGSGDRSPQPGTPSLPTVLQQQGAHEAQDGSVNSAPLHGHLTPMGVERQPMIGHFQHEGDNFKSLNRMLVHSDSDSFKNLLGMLASGSHQPS